MVEFVFYSLGIDSGKYVLRRKSADQGKEVRVDQYIFSDIRELFEYLRNNNVRVEVYEDSVQDADAERIRKYQEDLDNIGSSVDGLLEGILPNPKFLTNF